MSEEEFATQEEQLTSLLLSEASEYSESLSSSSVLPSSLLGAEEEEVTYQNHLQDFEEGNSDMYLPFERGHYQQKILTLDPVFCEGDTLLSGVKDDCGFAATFATCVHGHIIAALPSLIFSNPMEGRKLFVSFPVVCFGKTEASGFAVLNGVIEVMKGCWRFRLDATMFSEQMYPFVLRDDLQQGVNRTMLSGIPSFSWVREAKTLDIFKKSALTDHLTRRYLFYSGDFIFRAENITSIQSTLMKMGRDFCCNLKTACATVELDKPSLLHWGNGFCNWKDFGPKKYDFRQFYNCVLLNKGDKFTVPFDDRFSTMAQLTTAPEKTVSKSSLLVFYSFIEPFVLKIIKGEIEQDVKDFISMINVGDRLRYSLMFDSSRTGPELLDVQMMRKTWCPANTMKFLNTWSNDSILVTQLLVKLPREWFPVMRLSFSFVNTYGFHFTDVDTKNSDNVHGPMNFLPVHPELWSRDEKEIGDVPALYTSLAAYGMSATRNPPEYDSLGLRAREIKALYVSAEVDTDFDNANEGQDVDFKVKKHLLIDAKSPTIMVTVIALIAEVNVECMRYALESWLMDDKKGRFNDLNFADKLWKIMHKTQKVTDNTRLHREWEEDLGIKKGPKWSKRSVDCVTGRGSKRYVFKRSADKPVEKKSKKNKFY